jgi:asparagine synthase (glutamine-hydrolysing)
MADPQAVTYDGVAGDVLSAGHFHDDENSRLYRDGRFDELARRLAPDVPLVLLPKPLREVVDAIDPYPALIAELLRYRDTQNPMMFFFLYNRSRRAVSVVFHRLWGSVLRAVYLPFLDKDIFDFLIGLPEEMFADKSFHTEAIGRAYPKVSEIPFAKKTPIPGELQRRYAKQGFRFALSATSPLLDRAALLPRMGRALIGRKYEAEANWLVHQAVMLYQLGQLQTIRN